MTTVRFNVSRMFAHLEPWDCSNSVANLGPRAADLTWANALKVARCADEWLLSPRPDALDYIDDWARETGAWDAEERAAWTDEECLALLVQNVASDLRELGSDDLELSELVGFCHDLETTGMVSTHIWNEAGEVHGEVCS